MDPGLLAQYVMNGLMLGMMYALVAVGFTLFFGVLDVIKFSHGDVLTVGAFTALATFIGLQRGRRRLELARSARACWSSPIAGDGVSRLRDRALPGPAAALRAGAQHAADHADARHGAARSRAAVLSAGRQSRSRSRALLPTSSINFGNFNLRLDNAIMLAAGVAGHRRPAAPAQPHQARPRHPRRGAGRGDRAHHGRQLQRRSC